MEPPPPDMPRLLAAVHRNRQATDDFLSAMAGTLQVPEFLAPADVERMVAGDADLATVR